MNRSIAKRRGRNVRRISALAMAIVLAMLALPALSAAYGGGGGGGGGGSGGGLFGSSGTGALTPQPMKGIEGMPVTPPDAFGSLGSGSPAGPSSTSGPQSSSKVQDAIGGFIADKLKDQVIDAVTALHPGVGMALNTADKIYSAGKFAGQVADKLAKEKKSYQKAALGTLGSGLKAPSQSTPTLGPSTGMGAGPGPLHENNFLW
ncbi:MAG: hypothetical protein PHX58_07090 [Desulfovibrio sp.]|nr:hypothetical protein [Desulfovibrio sp.]